MTVIGWILGIVTAAALVAIVGCFALSELMGGVPGPAMRERR